MSAADTSGREAARQAALLGAVQPGGHVPGPGLALRAPQAGLARGLQVYQANAGAAAERALAAAYPTVAALIGGESMAALARVFWRAQPPRRGDLGEFGSGLPAFIADSPTLASEPYLPDVARLDWLVHQAARAADAPATVQALERLGDTDPDRLQLLLVPGTALLRSRWPVVTIWQAHQPLPEGQPQPADRFADVRAAMAVRRGEAAAVWRQGWHVRVAALGPAASDFTRALLAGQVLSEALDAAPDLDFASWLGEALQQDRLAGVRVLPPVAPEGESP